MATTSSITSGGMIDVNGLVTSLMSVEKRPVDLLTAKQTSFQAKLSAVGNIKSAVSSFQSTMNSLSNVNSFQTTTATSGDSSVFSAVAGSSATAGTYSVEITKIAQAQKLATTGQASATTAIGTGTLSFDFGSIAGGTFNPVTGTYSGAGFTSNGSGVQTVTIDATNNTLQGIRDAINTAKIGVSASIVNDGSGTPYRLVLSSTTTGGSNSMKISVGGGDPALTSLLAQDPAGPQSLAETATAQNAQLKVDGISISKSSNTITDAIPGITLTLKKPSTSAIPLDVATDNGTLTKSVQSFVDAYNTLNKSLSTALASGVIGSTAPLHGDSLLRSLQSQVSSVLRTALPSPSGAFDSLSQIGVSFQKDGSLALNTTKLNDAISLHASDIAKVFTTSGGYADQLNKLATAALATDGSLTNRTAGLNSSIRDIGKQIDSMNVRMTVIEARLRKQYSALDAMLGNMNTTSNYLTTQLSKL